MPEITIGTALMTVPIGKSRKATKSGASFITLHLGVASASFVADAHKRGLKVYVFTVNEIKDYDRMKTYGVDGIFTNYPDRFLGL